MQRFAAIPQRASHRLPGRPSVTIARRAAFAIAVMAALVLPATSGARDASVQAAAPVDLPAVLPLQDQRPASSFTSTGGTYRIVNVTFSDPNSDHLWKHGDHLDITVTVDRAVTVDSKSSVGTWSDHLGDGTLCNHPTEGGSTDQAFYRSGNGSTELIFRCTINGPPVNRVVVPANSIDLKNVSSDYYINQHPEYVRASPTHGLTAPTITGITIAPPPNGPFWTGGDHIDFHITFSENVTVHNPDSHKPYITGNRVIESRGGNADSFIYESGSGTSTLVFRHRLNAKAGPARAYELVSDQLHHRAGYIIAEDDKALADLSHGEYKGATALAVPCGSNPNDLWCTSLTVGKNAAGTELGFQENSHGSLTDEQFTHSGNTHEVTELNLDTTTNRLRLDIDPDSSASPFTRRTLRLDMGARVLWLPADEFTNSGKTIIWHNVQDLWNEDDVVTVRLTRPQIPELSQWRPHVHGPPTIVNAVSNADWSRGDSVNVTLNFIRPVYVNTRHGTPTIRLGVGKDTRLRRTAAYSSGSGTRDITFSYSVGNEGSFTLARVILNSLRLNDGAIQGIESRTHAKTAHDGAIARAVASNRSTNNNQRSTAPTAHFQDPPAAHNRSPFKLELKFSGAPDDLTPGTHAASALQVTNGSVTQAKHKDKGANPSWEITITPSGDENVTVVAPNRTCDQASAICINAQPLASAAAVTVEGPFHAAFPLRPASHDASQTVVLHMDFGQTPRSDFSWKSIDGGVLDVTNGQISRVWRRTKGNDQFWGVNITPASTADVTVAVNATTDCAADHAVCNDYGRMLAAGDPLIIQGPPLLSVDDATATESDDATLVFPVTLNRVPDTSVTVSYATSDGSASAGEDYTAASGTLTFTADEISKSISVTVLNDDLEESAETLTLTLSSASNAALADGTATGTIVNTPSAGDTTQDPPADPPEPADPPTLTATHSNAPTSHDGRSAFTFHLEFSETPKTDFSYKTLVNHAFTVTNGTVNKARRLDPPGNVRWEITITPAGTSATTVTLPSTTDCTASGAICTDDDRKFTGPLTLTIGGPEPPQ